MLRYLVRAKDCKNTEQLLENVRNETVTLYSASKRLVDSMIKTHAIGTVYNHRSFLPGFWESVLGEPNFSRRTFDRLVPIGKVYVTRPKLVPTTEQIRSILRMSPPLYRALIAFLAVTGMRISEVLNLKRSNLEIVQPAGYGRVTIQASASKARYRRFAFVTREIIEWINVYSTWSGTSPYLFPGENETHPLCYGSALEQIKHLFVSNGMKDSELGIYSPHSFRTYASDAMRTCQLPEKAAMLIIGHKGLGAESAYVNPQW